MRVPSSATTRTSFLFTKIQPYPVCPAHPGGRVVRDGFYGRQRPGYFRHQRFRCYPHPKKQRPFHRFTEPLPRRHVPSIDDCLECERDRLPWQGPRIPRRYQFTVHDVAEALLLVGAGRSYRAAGYVLRAAMQRPARRRLSTAPCRRAVSAVSDGAHLVQDFVEVYGPVLTAPFDETAWPDVLLLDEFSFRKKNPWHRPGGDACFSVLCAYGYERRGYKGRLWLVRSYPNHDAASWLHFLNLLPGVPRLIVCDGSHAIREGIAFRWPGSRPFAGQHVRPGEQRRPKVRMSHYHLAQTLATRLGVGGVTAERLATARAALASPSGWADFAALVHPYETEVLQWMYRHRRQIILHFLLARRPDPFSTGALEKAAAVLRTSLAPRRTTFTNRARTDRLLDLMRLEANGVATLQRYHELLTASLRTRDGRPAQSQRLICDPLGQPTLR